MANKIGQLPNNNWRLCQPVPTETTHQRSTTPVSITLGLSVPRSFHSRPLYGVSLNQ
ncbi:MAG: hypothetical protein GY820_02465 [Gammaproteobacteria bacterium]|nr:hypothetical protein [Gammaproteobacteria bacterium]